MGIDCYLGLVFILQSSGGGKNIKFTRRQHYFELAGLFGPNRTLTIDIMKFNNKYF